MLAVIVTLMSLCVTAEAGFNSDVDRWDEPDLSWNPFDEFDQKTSSDRFRWPSAESLSDGALQGTSVSASIINFEAQPKFNFDEILEADPARDNRFSFRGQSPVMPSESTFIEPAYGSGGPYNTAVPSGWRWTFLPQGFLYRTYFASSAEPRLSTQIFRDLQRGSLLDTSAGGRFGIVRFGERYDSQGFQLDILGNAKLRQNADSGLDMTGTDFRFDIPITYRNGPHAVKFGYYHISAHAGDEFLVSNPGFQRLNYLRDAFNLGYSYNVNPETRLYAEIDWAFNTDVSKPWHFQFGLDYGPAYPTGATGAPFFAVNVHLREEVDFGGNVHVQAGWAWRGEGLTAGTLRTGPFYYNGKSPQFSFYDQSEQQVGWGLWYDF